MFRKRNSAVKGDPKNSIRIEAESGVKHGEAGVKVSLMGINLEEEASHLLGLRRRQQCSNQRSFFSLYSSRYQGGRRIVSHVVSMRRVAH